MTILSKQSGSFGWNRNHFLIVLTLVYLLTHLLLLNFVPFMRDEGLYAVMIEEQITHPTLVSTFLGYEVAWKPIGFFWTYGFFVELLRGINLLPIEAVYRLPGTFFGLINVYLVFFIFKKLLDDEHDAFLASLLYLSIFLIINVDSRVLTDTLCGTTILAGILCYMNGLSNNKYFLLGGIFTFITYFVKQVNAATIPVVAIAYLFEKDKKRLFEPSFLISILSYPLAMWLFDISIADLKPPGAVNEYFLQNTILSHLNPILISGSLFTFFLLTGAWMTISLFGMLKNWRQSITMTTWYALIVFPMLGGILMPWYFYPVMAPIAYFSLQFLIRDTDGKVIKDKFFYGVFFLLAVGGIALGVLAQNDYYNGTIGAKHAGEFLAGKEDVLIIGIYEPTIPSYKMLEEKRSSGNWLDYGWIIMPNSSGKDYQIFLENYHANVSGIIDGNFMDLFLRQTIYRKDTNISSFRYICLIGNETVNPGGKLVFNESSIIIYNLSDGFDAGTIVESPRE